MQQQWSRTAIPEETRKEVCKYTTELIKSHTYTNISAIADKFNISYNSVRRILAANGITIPVKINYPVKEKKLKIDADKIKILSKTANTNTKSVKTEEESHEEEVAAPIIDTDSTTNKLVKGFNFTKLEVSRVVKAITCSERHSINGYAKSIFGTSVTSEEMFDFQALENKALAFIDSELHFVNGISTDELEVMVTGLTMLVTSVISACAKRHVNLTLLHYNRDTRQYEKQVIFNNKVESSSPIISFLNSFSSYSNFDGIYVYRDCNVYGITSEFYMVKVMMYSIMNKYEPKKISYYITDNFEDSFEMYSKLLKMAKDTKIAETPRIAVQYTECSVKSNGTVNVGGKETTTITKIYLNQ